MPTTAYTSLDGGEEPSCLNWRGRTNLEKKLMLLIVVLFLTVFVLTAATVIVGSRGQKCDNNSTTTTEGPISSTLPSSVPPTTTQKPPTQSPTTKTTEEPKPPTTTTKPNHTVVAAEKLQGEEITTIVSETSREYKDVTEGEDDVYDYDYSITEPREPDYSDEEYASQEINITIAKTNITDEASTKAPSTNAPMLELIEIYSPELETEIKDEILQKISQEVSEELKLSDPNYFDLDDEEDYDDYGDLLE